MENHSWDLMREDDLPAVEEVMNHTYPHLSEDIESFREKIRLFPEGSRVLRKASEDVVVGYLISFPWTSRRIPPLSSLLRELPVKAEVYYIHDIALLPEAQGIGAARAILSEMSQVARSLHINRFTLVALAPANAFWKGRGFRPVQDVNLKEKLMAYGEGAEYMQRPVD